MFLLNVFIVYPLLFAQIFHNSVLYCFQFMPLTHTYSNMYILYMYIYRSIRKEHMVSSYRVKMVKVIANTIHMQSRHHKKCADSFFLSFIHSFRLLVSSIIACKGTATSNCERIFPFCCCCLCFAQCGWLPLPSLPSAV